AIVDLGVVTPRAAVWHANDLDQPALTADPAPADHVAQQVVFQADVHPHCRNALVRRCHPQRVPQRLWFDRWIAFRRSRRQAARRGSWKRRPRSVPGMLERIDPLVAVARHPGITDPALALVGVLARMTAQAIAGQPHDLVLIRRLARRVGWSRPLV